MTSKEDPEQAEWREDCIQNLIERHKSLEFIKKLYTFWDTKEVTAELKEILKLKYEEECFIEKLPHYPPWKGEENYCKRGHVKRANKRRYVEIENKGGAFKTYKAETPSVREDEECSKCGCNFSTYILRSFVIYCALKHIEPRNGKYVCDKDIEGETLNSYVEFYNLKRYVTGEDYRYECIHLIKNDGDINHYIERVIYKINFDSSDPMYKLPFSYMLIPYEKNKKQFSKELSEGLRTLIGLVKD